MKNVLKFPKVKRSHKKTAISILKECELFIDEAKTLTTYHIPTFDLIIKKANCLQNDILSIKTEALSEHEFDYYCEVVENLTKESLKLINMIKRSRFTLLKSS